MTRLLVIPSWARLPPEMVAETGCQLAALIPLGGRPLYEHVVAAHREQAPGLRCVLIVPPGASLEPAPGRSDMSGFMVRTLASSRSIGDTVLAGLHELLPDEPVSVQMADTLLRLDEPIVDDAVYVQARDDLYRWTSVACDPAGRLQVLHDRDDIDPHDEPQNVCVGLFTFSQGALLRQLLQEEVEHTGHDAPDPFFRAIERYSVLKPMVLRQPAHWLDCGHVDTYYEARLGWQNLRHFNSLRYDARLGQVTKTSANREAFRHQVRWYKQVPDSLAAFLPRIYGSHDGEEPFVTMELLSIPTLSELFVQARMGLGAWNGVVQTIAHILGQFGAYRQDTPLASVLAERIYVAKTRERLLSFLQACPEAESYHLTDVAGPLGALDLRLVLQTLDEFVEGCGLLALDTLTPIHGDFCFSNLMYDPKVRLVRMIDPRGEFGVPGIYGDARYDLAKLAHSFDGGYDFIVSDRFDVALRNNVLTLRLDVEPYHVRVRALFERMLLREPLQARSIRGIQALLFLSMLPLHQDRPHRQLAMLATGLRLYRQSLTELRTS